VANGNNNAAAVLVSWKVSGVAAMKLLEAFMKISFRFCWYDGSIGYAVAHATDEINNREVIGGCND
jgi:hypothetical protein